jgi:hypothetical protein
MSTSSNTTIDVQYDLYKTTMNYSISINTPNIIHNIKFTNLPRSSQIKTKQKKEIIIVNDNHNNMPKYWFICIILALFLFINKFLLKN